MYITAQGPRLRNDLHCVKWGYRFLFRHSLFLQFLTLTLTLTVTLTLTLALTLSLTLIHP